MTDSKLLKDLIHAKGLKLQYIAEYLGLTRYGLSLKINNVNEFKASEIRKLCQLLEISSLRLKEKIFYKEESDLKSQ